MPDWLPGVKPIRMSNEPLGTRGELTVGPDNLDPEIPEQRKELEERGYLNPEVEDDPEDLPGVGVEPGFERPVSMSSKAPLEEEFDLGLPEL